MHRLDLDTVRLPGLLLTAAVLAVSGCDAPTPTSTADGLDLVAEAPRVTSVARYTVDVNVKHGNEKNGFINLNGVRNSGGGEGNGASLTVSVLGTGEFQLGAIDPSSIRIGDATTVPITPLSVRGKKYQYSVVDLNGDGILDLMMHFSIPDMVENGNLSESTTSLCMIGAGPGWIVDGCGDVSTTREPNDNGNGGGPTPKPVEVEIMPFGAIANPEYHSKTGFMAQVQYWLDDPTTRFPGWTTEPLTSIPGAWTRSPEWTLQPLLVGSEGPTAPDGFLQDTCGLTTSDYYWGVHTQLLIRTDLELPAGASGVVIQYVVDNDARIYLNGVELTNGFKAGQNSGCASYDRAVTVRVPDAVLSADGSNKLAIWARDFGYVNFFDIRVTADVPPSP